MAVQQDANPCRVPLRLTGNRAASPWSLAGIQPLHTVQMHLVTPFSCSGKLLRQQHAQWPAVLSGGKASSGMYRIPGQHTATTCTSVAATSNITHRKSHQPILQKSSAPPPLHHMLWHAALQTEAYAWAAHSSQPATVDTTPFSQHNLLSRFPPVHSHHAATSTPSRARCVPKSTHRLSLLAGTQANTDGTTAHPCCLSKACCTGSAHARSAPRQVVCCTQARLLYRVKRHRVVQEVWGRGPLHAPKHRHRQARRYRCVHRVRGRGPHTHTRVCWYRCVQRCVHRSRDRLHIHTGTSKRNQSITAKGNPQPKLTRKPSKKATGVVSPPVHPELPHKNMRACCESRA
jgi:hypothetical protein